MKNRLLYFVAALGLLVLPEAIKADSFVYSSGAFTRITIPNTPDGLVFAHGINDTDQVVGSINGIGGGGGGSGMLGGFVQANGMTTPVIDPASNAGNDAFGISNNGIIVGSGTVLSMSRSQTHGFIDDHGTFTTVNYPLSTGGDTFLFGVNNAGQAVGSFSNGVTTTVFVYSGGTFTPVTTPGIPSDLAAGINDLGQIVGSYAVNFGPDHGFINTNGVVRTLDFPGADSTFLTGINDAGEVVGYYLFGDGSSHGFMYSNGVFTTFDAPVNPHNAVHTSLYGVNDVGQVVGNDPGFATPEPASIVLVFSGVAVTVLLLRKGAPKPRVARLTSRQGDLRS